MNEDGTEIINDKYSELRDRLYIMGINFESNILSHPLINNINDDRLMESLIKSLEGICESYERISELNKQNDVT